jgi:AhpD family alkylhydroperoxidase
MTARLDYRKSEGALKALYALQGYCDGCSIEPALQHLVELRVSQINGCAFCVDMHANQLRAVGESAQRIDLVAVWHEAPFYSERERAALTWAESVTLLAEHGVSDELYEEARAHFSEAELVDLNMVVVTINTWNRFSVGFAKMPPERRAHKASTP